MAGEFKVVEVQVVEPEVGERSRRGYAGTGANSDESRWPGSPRSPQTVQRKHDRSRGLGGESIKGRLRESVDMHK